MYTMPDRCAPTSEGSAPFSFALCFPFPVDGQVVGE